MSDSKISSSGSPPALTGATSGGKPAGLSGAVQGASPNAPVQDAAVRQSPPNILLSGTTTELRGTVLSSNPARGQIDISTPKGELIVQSNQDIPAGTDVAIRLTSRNNQLLATLTIIKQPAPPPPVPEPPVPETVPPLNAGDTVPAVRLSPPSNLSPQNSSAPVETQVPLTLQQIAQILQSLPPAALARLPGPPPVPLATLYTLLQASDMQAALAQLPTALQQALNEYAARADVQQVVRALAPQNQPSPPPPQSPEQDAQAMLRAQMGAFMQSAPAARLGVAGGLFGLSSLLPLLQTLEARAAQPAGSVLNALRQDTQAGAQGLLPQNLQSLTVVSIAPPPSAGAVPQAQQAVPDANLLTGTVVSITPSGFPVIQTQDGQDFVLRTQAPVTVGSTIVFRLSQFTPQGAAAHFGNMHTALPQDAVFNPLLATSWPALGDAMRALAAISAQTAQQLTNALPAPAARFAPATLLFLAALRLDSVQSWLGGGLLQTLRTGDRQTIADKLSADFSKISEQARTPLPGGWRGISLPLMHEAEIAQAQLFWRRQDDPAEDSAGAGRKSPMTRFLLNLHLSKLGDMQLDGLMRQKRLDMILRGEKMLPPSIRRDITAAYAQSMAQTGMDGTIGFQARADQWVSIDVPHASGFSA